MTSKAEKAIAEIKSKIDILEKEIQITSTETEANVMLIKCIQKIAEILKRCET